jgi:hypothetical protein
MPFLELFDETLDINSTENYEISIDLSPEGLAFCLNDTTRNRYILMRSFEPDDSRYFNAGNLTDIIEKDDFLRRRYRKVNLITTSPRFTLVPSPLFDPARKDDYFVFNHARDDNDVIITNKLTDPDAFLVFSIPMQVSEIIRNYYPGIHPHHHIKPLLNHISLKRRNTAGMYTHIHTAREFFNLIVYEQNLLKFCNAFKYRNITDIEYFVFNVFKKLGISREETVELSGQVEKYDDLSSNLSLYVKNVKFSEPQGNFTFSYAFNNADLHRFLNLFSVINCE